RLDSSSPGGFSALGGTMQVRLNGGTGLVVFAAGNGAPIGLVLSSAHSDALTDLQNAIDLNGANRTFNVADNPFSSADYARLSSTVSSPTGGIVKTGFGTLELTGANTYG